MPGIIEICVDPNDFEGLVSLMNRHDEFDTTLMGTNERGEFVTSDILEDRVIQKTLQDNGWTRTNVYHRDGTVEELYSKE